MKKNATIFSLFTCFVILTIFPSCSKNKMHKGCNQDVVISKTEYETAPDAHLSILDLKIDGDCLTIRFNASGCGGNSWITKLIDAGTIDKTLPPQRTLRLSLDNQELCAMLVTKEISYNIKPLQVQGAKAVVLNVSGKSILYQY